MVSIATHIDLSASCSQVRQKSPASLDWLVGLFSCLGFGKPPSAAIGISLYPPGIATITDSIAAISTQARCGVIDAALEQSRSPTPVCECGGSGADDVGCADAFANEFAPTMDLRRTQNL
jgi:hypothetical protein